MEQRAESGPEGTAFGFLTVVDSPTHGLFGGYLLVDGLGRPLEFHCTAPVKISRAQQILYGSTLHGHLHGRQIGATLLAEATVTPSVVLTDHDALLQVRPHTSLPVVLARPLTDDPPPGCFTIGATSVAAPPGDADAAAIRGPLAELGAAIDLVEPFERIRAAIAEAQRH